MSWHQYRSAIAVPPACRRSAAAITLLMSLGAGTLQAQEDKVSGTAELTTRATREITALHEFFQGWFQGTRSRGDFARFERVLDAGFTIVTPSGRAFDRHGILEAVRGQYGRDSTTMLEIRHVTLRQVIGDVAIVSYEEWQHGAAAAPRGRMSTVVFTRDEGAPNQLRWLLVHETWLPERRTP